MFHKCSIFNLKIRVVRGKECASGIDLTGRGIFIDHLSGRVGERVVLEGQSKQKRRHFQHNIYLKKRLFLILKIWAKGGLLV